MAEFPAPGNRCGFRVAGFPDDLFHVVELQGADTLGGCYSFNITLAVQGEGVDPEAMVRRQACLTLTGRQVNAYGGLVFSFRRMQAVKDLSFYQAVLSPRLRLLTLSQHNQVFLNQPFPDILESVFRECGIADYELRLQGAYDPMEYVCQYNETHYDFLARWMEHLGIYYHFEQSGQDEKIVVTDSRLSHRPIQEAPFPFRQPSGLDHAERIDTVTSFETTCKLVPQKVVLKDYNPDRPSLDLTVEAQVSAQGQGALYQYGDHYDSTSQGSTLARIRAEELLGGQTTVAGTSMIPQLRSGALLSLSGHPAREANTSYLITQVAHKGRFNRRLTAGLPGFSTEGGDKDMYGNAFQAMPAERQHRPPRRTPRPRLYGFLPAVIDAAGSGEYAELDDQGRYTVRLPFDLADRPGGKASHRIRLAEPYAGPGCGLHFPLLKGSEILLAFLDGDPDRPVIAGALHNAAHTNVLNDRRQAFNVIRTPANNQIVMNDERGQEGIGLYTPVGNTQISLGGGPDGKGLKLSTDEKYFLCAKGGLTTVCQGSQDEIVLGQKGSLSLGASSDAHIGPSMKFSYGGSLSFDGGAGVSLGTGRCEIDTGRRSISGYEELRLRAGVGADGMGLTKNLWKAWLNIVAANAANAVQSSFVKKVEPDFFNPCEPYLDLGLMVPNVLWGMLIKKQINSAQAGLESVPVAGEILVDSQGVALKADAAGRFEFAGVNLTVGPTDDPTNRLYLGSRASNHGVRLENSQGAETAGLKLTGGNRAVLKTGRAEIASLDMTSAGEPRLTLKAKTDGSQTIAELLNDSFAIKDDAGAPLFKVGTESKTVTAAAGESSVKVGRQGVSVKAKAISLDGAAKVKITQAGKVLLGG